MSISLSTSTPVPDGAAPPAGGRGLRRWLPGVALFLPFAALGVAVALAPAPLWDRAVALAAHGIIGPASMAALRVATRFGDDSVSTPLMILTLALLTYRRLYRYALGLAVVVVGSQGLVGVVKFLVARERPNLWPGIEVIPNYSFPSGHAVFAVTVSATLVAFVWERHRSRAARTALLAGVLLLTAMVGLSRVALGVHYPSDVLAGYTLGGCWAYLWLGPLRGAWQARAAGQSPAPLGWVLALALFAAARSLRPAWQLPPAVEALLAVAGLCLVGFGLWTRLRRHAPDPGGHRGAREWPGQSALLLGAGLCLLLNDPFVLAAFAFLYYLWWACGRDPGSRAADRKALPPIPPALVGRLTAVSGLRGNLCRALGREGDVMGCAVALAAWLGYRDWLAGWHSLAALPGRGTLVVIGLILLALIWRRALPELRRCRG